MNDTNEFCMFNLSAVYVYGSFPFDLDAIYLILVHINPLPVQNGRHFENPP